VLATRIALVPGRCVLTMTRPLADRLNCTTEQALHRAALRYATEYLQVDWLDRAEGDRPNPEIQYPDMKRAPAAGESLYARLGGAPGVQAIADTLIDRVVANPVMGLTFKDFETGSHQAAARRAALQIERRWLPLLGRLNERGARGAPHIRGAVLQNGRHVAGYSAGAARRSALHQSTPAVVGADEARCRQAWRGTNGVGIDRLGTGTRAAATP
jgi:hypothetical protein